MKRIPLIVFAAIAAIQLAVPIYLIADREYVIQNGKVYHLRTEPVDPYDAFRGRYVYLKYEFEGKLKEDLEKRYLPTGNPEGRSKKKIYVTFKRNSDGFASIEEISEAIPSTSYYIAIPIVLKDYDESISLTVPFNRFYMDEFKAPEAESAYQEESGRKNAYAVVRVKNGRAVITDLMIDGTPIRKYLLKRIRSKKR